MERQERKLVFFGSLDSQLRLLRFISEDSIQEELIEAYCEFLLQETGYNYIVVRDSQTHALVHIAELKGIRERK